MWPMLFPLEFRQCHDPRRNLTARRCHYISDITQKGYVFLCVEGKSLPTPPSPARSTYLSTRKARTPASFTCPKKELALKTEGNSHHDQISENLLSYLNIM